MFPSKCHEQGSSIERSDFNMLGPKRDLTPLIAPGGGKRLDTEATDHDNHAERPKRDTEAPCTPAATATAHATAPGPVAAKEPTAPIWRAEPDGHGKLEPCAKPEGGEARQPGEAAPAAAAPPALAPGQLAPAGAGPPVAAPAGAADPAAESRPAIPAANAAAAITVGRCNHAHL